MRGYRWLLVTAGLLVISLLAFGGGEQQRSVNDKSVSTSSKMATHELSVSPPLEESGDAVCTVDAASIAFGAAPNDSETLRVEGTNAGACGEKEGTRRQDFAEK